jgi:hypothetical protein
LTTESSSSVGDERIAPAPGTGAFSMMFEDVTWERAEKPSLQITWAADGPDIDHVTVVALSSAADPAITIQALGDDEIVVRGLNPYANITLRATPYWHALGYGTTLTQVVPAGAKGPHPKNPHPVALRDVKLTGERPNPCMAMHWKYNLAGQGFDALPAITDAVRSISAATGIETIYDGITSEYEGGTGDYDPATVDVDHPRTWMLVQWEDPAKPVTNDVESANSVVLGLGTAGFRRQHPGQPSDFADGGSLTFRRSPLLNDPTTFRTTALHELGHVFGLGHVTDQTSLMYPYAEGVTTWNAYDRMALAAIGRPGSEGCL